MVGLNAVDKTLSLPEDRILSLVCSIESVLDTFPLTTARSLAKITGKIISMPPFFGNITRLMTRNLYLTIENRLSWDSPLDLWGREDTTAELVFWITNVRSLNIRKLLEHLPPRLLGYSDASDKACGAFMVSCDNIDSIS